MKSSQSQVQSNLSEVCGQFCLYWLVKRHRRVSFEDIMNEFSTTNLMSNDKIVKTFVVKRF